MRALIVAGGDPLTNDQIRSIAEKSDLVLAADSGLHSVLESRLLPDVFAGDMDSVAEEDKERITKEKTEIIYLPTEKDETDTMFCAMLAAERGADEVVLIGATGGKNSHMLANLFVLEYLRSRKVKARIISRDEEFTLLHKGDKVTLFGHNGAKVSVFPYMGEATATKSSGLKYPLDHICFTDVFCGVSNEMTGNTAEIVGTEGKILVVAENRGNGWDNSIAEIWMNEEV